MDRKKLRYILYARKSEEDKKRQVRSIDDQISDCMALAKREGLTILRIIKEEKSAKKKYNRPEFDNMIKDIKEGKADGILAWHPDRLSRNPIDSATIIDLLDEGVIKDLAFPTCQFTNDSSGKMLLNILFAISKQYSEHIGEGVSRAFKQGLQEGKSSGMAKWGYNRNENGFYVPDENFDAIKEAWSMKVNGATNEQILAYLRKSDVHRMTKNDPPRRINLYPNTISAIFQDPIYYGILVQAKQEIDLIEATKDAVDPFQPMITKEMYDTVQEISASRTRGNIRKTRATPLPLSNMVFCGECGKPMGPARSGGNGGHYLYYRCTNKDCSRRPRDVRAKCIFEPLYEAVRSFDFTDKEYDEYSKKVGEITEEAIEQLRMEKRSLEGQIRHKNTLIDDHIKALPHLTKGSVGYNRAQKDLEKIGGEISELQIRVQDIKQQINKSDQIALSKEEFLNLMKILPEQIENGSGAEKDALARLLLLNLTIDNEKRPHFLWKEPFQTLIEAKELRHGVGYRDRTDDLLDHNQTL